MDSGLTLRSDARSKPMWRSGSRRRAGMRPGRRAVSRGENRAARPPRSSGGLQELEALLAGSPLAMSDLEDAPPNANPTSDRYSTRTRCFTRE
jgi:hypothetical protein